VPLQGWSTGGSAGVNWEAGISGAEPGYFRNSQMAQSSVTKALGNQALPMPEPSSTRGCLCNGTTRLQYP